MPKINKIALQNLDGLSFVGIQEWMRSVKNAIYSGTYTPTLTNVTNITTSTAFTCQYLVIENTVTVSGKVSVDTAGAGAAELGISLPVASDFTAEEQCGGNANTISGTHNGAGILADATNDRASMQWNAAGVGGARTWSFSFTYQIL